MIDEYESDEKHELQQQATKFIYVQISKMFDELSAELTPEEIAEIAINAVAINLGTLIGQCHDDHRDEIMIASKKLIDYMCLTTIKKSSYYSYGMIGHA